MTKEQETRAAFRFDAVVATFVGVCALFVSGYTAYVQRQQVRAAVWPILEFESSNAPDIHFTLANKGVGPAIIRHVRVTVDGRPMVNWRQIMEKLLGPELYHGSETDISSRVLSAGESLTVFAPYDAEGNPLNDRSNPLWIGMNKDRERVVVEICYASTLGEYWILRSGGKSRSTTTEARSCPGQSATSFEQ